MYDLIGDIHGHADELTQLLETLGYEKAQGVYGHPERKVIFLGDFIDRGPKIRQVLEIVRPMIDEGKALSVMGNHELNALAYHTKDPLAVLLSSVDISSVSSVSPGFLFRAINMEKVTVTFRMFFLVNLC